ncbi:MAG: GIY-YIG nuclease family protein [Candidatus Peribacteraceae bacterium]|nr:GIY-YIG nuclease family protein [Candidatus Peribacteraceae bacterium]
MPHYFYLARCSDNSLYAGTCIDLSAREKKHNEGRGAKYTRSRLPIVFVYHEKFRTLGAARRREAAVKKFAKEQKESLVLKKRKPRKASHSRQPR